MLKYNGMASNKKKLPQITTICIPGTTHYMHFSFLRTTSWRQTDKTRLNITVSLYKSLAPSIMYENFTSQTLTNALYCEKNVPQCHFVHQKILEGMD